MTIAGCIGHDLSCHLRAEEFDHFYACTLQNITVTKTQRIDLQSHTQRKKAQSTLFKSEQLLLDDGAGIEFLKAPPNAE